jgi:outer membrane murein-binding lipoprotein Lpp
MSALLLMAGCAGKPSAANIELRKDNQDLQQQIDTLHRQNDALSAQVKSLQSTPGYATLPLPTLQKLYTVHGLSFGRLTGGDDIDPEKPGDEQLKVYVCPTDDDGQPIKAAGAFKVELFDLAKSGDTRIGTWNFSTEQARALWFGRALLYTYVLSCPWQRPPTHADLTVRVTYVDELTHRTFTAETPARVAPPIPAHP